VSDTVELAFSLEKANSKWLRFGGVTGVFEGAHNYYYEKIK